MCLYSKIIRLSHIGKRKKMCFVKDLEFFLTFFIGVISVCKSFDLDGSSESYGKFALWQPCSNGSVSFQFKTTLSDALLFYADGIGDGDYYELKLVNGIVNLRFRLQNDRRMLSNGQNLGDDNWHTVDIMREGHLTTLRVDGLSYATEHISYDHSNENTEVEDDKYVFIGGLPKGYNDRLQLHTVVYEPHLRGSIQNLFFGNCGKPLARPEDMGSRGLILQNDECLQNNPCRNDGICVMRENGVQCDCSWTEYTGKFCEMEEQPVEAMFQGSQYLSYDLTNRGEPISSGKDRLSLRFKTTYSDGLLFYTGYEKDYMTVSLQGGTIHVSMELGSGGYSDRVDMSGYQLDDGQWHHLVVNRDSRQIKIEIDGVNRAVGTTMGKFDKLSSNAIYVGGSSITPSIPGTDVTENFRGCMKQVEYTADAMKLELVELASRRDPLLTVYGDVQFGQCEEVIESQPITFTTPQSFIALPRFDVSRKIATITLQFKTVEANGLILYNGGSFGNANSDFLAMEIIDGYIYLLLDLGSGSHKLRASRTRVDDGHPHIVFFQYGGKSGFIKVDAHQTDYETPGHRKQLELEQLLFIGGLDFDRHNAYRLPKELWSGILKYGYVGCLQDLVVNNNKIDLMTVARTQRQRDIVSGCHRSDNLCDSQPCVHKGTCMEGWNRFTCDCRATEYTGNTCDQVAATLSFDGAQYVLVSLPEESYTEVEDISIRFRTMRDAGLLMITASAQVSDSIELYLEQGAVKLTINLGTKFKTLSVGHALNDDQWHTVFVKRRGQKLELNVDEGRPVSDIIPNVATTVRMTQIVVGSAGPMLSDTYGSSNPDIIFEDSKLPMQMQRDSRALHMGFNGALQQFIFNGNHYFEMAKAQNHENIEVTARFDNGESVSRDPVTFESRDSYAVLPQLKPNKHFTIYFKFKSSESTGLILFNGRHGSDFLALELYQGYLYYIYNMGGGSQRIRVNTLNALNDNKWHDVSLLRPSTERQVIRVDNNPATVENMKDYSARRFDLIGPLYLGGVVKSLYNSLPGQVLARYGFLGCLASLEINGRPVNILEAADRVEYSVVPGCASSEMTCHANSCFNGGRCVVQWNSYVCDCDMTSFTGPACTEDSVTYRFGMERGLITFEYEASLRPSTNSDTLALGFRTIQNYAILARVDSVETDDYIQMELVQGKLMVLYNMGQHDTPIGEAYAKLNDNKYHVIKFKRLGANATLQVDNYDTAFKYPMETMLKLYPDLDVTDSQMTVFNDQARVWIGGRKGPTGQINNAFHGIMSGLFFNGHRILDYLKEGDPRVSSEGDLTLVLKSDEELGPPEDVIENDPNIQSTQGTKILKSRYRRFLKSDASTWKSFKNTQQGDNAYAVHPEIVQAHSFLDNSLHTTNNISKVKVKQTFVPYHQYVHRNTAQYHNENSISQSHSDSGSINSGTNQIKADHNMVGNFDLKSSPDYDELPNGNDDTFMDSSEYSIFGSGDLISDNDMLRPFVAKDFLIARKQYLRKLLKVYKASSMNSKDVTGATPAVLVERLYKTPFTKQYRFSKTSYPKDRGKQATQKSRKIRPTKPHSSKLNKHSSGTTPRQQVTDDIIFSGVGPDECMEDDIDRCITTTPEPTDEIVTVQVKITKLHRPVDKKPNNTVDPVPCKDEDCQPQKTTHKGTTIPEIFNNTTDNKNGNIKLGDPLDGKATHKKDNGHLNIFLIVGIVAGVLAALIILVVALYKFRNREEGSYRVDESQNFAYLEAKKTQSNGSAINNVGNGKIGGKKKDVKEWYV